MDKHLLMNNVLEPLSIATQKLLSPPTLMDHDRVSLSIADDDMKWFNLQICSSNDRRPSFRVSHGISKIPEQKLNTHTYNSYKVAATDFTALVLSHNFRNRILFKDDDTETLFLFLLQRFYRQTSSARLIADFKINGKVPDLPADFIQHPDDNRHASPYQIVAILASLETDGFAYFMEQGTGKTATTVYRTMLESRRKREGRLAGSNNRMYKVLVICPQQLRLNWKKEFQKFATLPGKVSVCRGGLMRRQKNIIEGCMEDADCYWGTTIISTDSVAATIDALSSVAWDLVVLDESHWIKNSNSRRYKKCKELSRLPHVRSRLELTGTPYGNSIMDLWAQLEFLGDGMSGFVDYKSFKKFHGNYDVYEDDAGRSRERLVSEKGVPLIKERLSRVSFTITKEEAGLNLPPKMYDIHEVEMTKQQAEVYKKLAKDLVFEIEDILADTSKVVSADHILTMMLRLAQVTSGHVKFNQEVDPNTGKMTGGDIQQISTINPKVEAVIQLCTEDKPLQEKTVVWCHFKEDVRILSEVLTARGISHVGYHKEINPKYRVADPSEAEEVINTDDSVRILIANPKSAGTGQNFFGFDPSNPDSSEMYVGHEVFMSSNWSMLDRNQAEDRAHRRNMRTGARGSMRITDVIVPGTVDEEIYDRVMSKREKALGLQDIKEILTKILI